MLESHLIKDYKNLSELNRNPENPRDIDEKELTMLRKSLDKFGDLSGFVVNVVSGNLVSGNQRSKVLPSVSKIEITERYEKPNAKGTIAIGYVVVDGEKHKYREVLFDEATEKAANIAANQQGGNFNLPALKEWVMELDELSIDLDLLGFKDDFLQTLIAPIHQAHGDEDAVPETPKEAKTKLGDIYKLGNHRLMCGDSTMIDNVEKLMDGSKADMVFTDPPYGIDEETDRAFASPTRKAKGNTFSKIIGDTSIDTALAAYSISDSRAPIICYWGGNYYAHKLQPSPCYIVWDKRVEENQRDMNSDCELAYVKHPTKKSVRIFRHLWKGMIKDSEQGKGRVHPTQKPIALAEWCFEELSKDSKNILDLFGGSGSTLIACEKTNRKCFMMELDPQYIDVIIKRFIKYSGKPVYRLINGDKIDVTKDFNI